MFSITPAPKTGVGMRKMMLLVAWACAKLGCGRLQAPASPRPVMVNKSSTPPLGALVLGLPFELKKKGKRASRTGPFAVTKDGMVFLAPSALASVTCGLVKGLVPPTAGWAWQKAQLLKWKPPPRPTPASIVPDTESTSEKRPSPSLKKSRMVTGVLAATDANGWPAPAAPPRTPGSLCAQAAPAKNKNNNDVSTEQRFTAFMFSSTRDGRYAPRSREPAPAVGRRVNLWRSPVEQPSARHSRLVRQRWQRPTWGFVVQVLLSLRPHPWYSKEKAKAHRLVGKPSAFRYHKNLKNLAILSKKTVAFSKSGAILSPTFRTCTENLALMGRRILILALARLRQHDVQ